MRAGALRYFLQAADDPSLLVPAGGCLERIWRLSSIPDAENWTIRRKKMLADLGKASKLFTPIEDSLNSATPVARAP